MEDNYIKFRETELFFKKFSYVLDQLDLADPAELKKYFTQYILIVFYKEFEDKFKEVLKRSLEKHFGSKSVELINKADVRLFRGIKIEDIKETINRWFGEESKQKFKSFQSQQTMSRYDNFIKNRHYSAHSFRNLSISWEEVKNINEIGEKMIKIVVSASSK